jgi:hypothetical protein
MKSADISLGRTRSPAPMFAGNKRQLLLVGEPIG